MRNIATTNYRNRSGCSDDKEDEIDSSNNNNNNVVGDLMDDDNEYDHLIHFLESYKSEEEEDE